jgi:hypothetical protein
MTIIYKQSYAGQCGSYSLLNALQLSGIDVTEQEVLSWWAILGFPDMASTLKKYGKAKWLGYLNSQNLIDSFLRRGKFLPCLLYRNNFNSTRYAPYLQDFRGNRNHFVCLVEDCGDRWKYRDQQWEDFWDKWHGYILKSDFKNIKVARIIF